MDTAVTAEVQGKEVQAVQLPLSRQARKATPSSSKVEVVVTRKKKFTLNMSLFLNIFQFPFFIMNNLITAIMMITQEPHLNPKEGRASISPYLFQSH